MKHSDLQSLFSNLVAAISQRPGIYFAPVTYDTVVAYLMGVDMVITMIGGDSQLQHFSEWLHKRVGHHCSLHWSAVVRELFAEDNDANSIQCLFRLLREFFQEEVPDTRLPAPGGR